jgi:predicted unusual protein kinase regulating ubiquinone biosynthesis (AarF/ABC1/UbiB family)
MPLRAKGVLQSSPQLKLSTLEPAAPLGWLIRRSLHWFLAGLLYSLGALWDRARGRRSPRDRARRVAEVFQFTGGFGIKIGRELALRMDLFSYEICDELSRLHAHPPPLDIAYVTERVELAAKKPFAEVFAVFDPHPIARGLTSCVYQAVLRSGARVAVKVRRPGAGPQLAADLRCAEWFTSIPEILSLVKPGFFDSLRRGLRKTLLEEIDFTREARYQRLFRQWARKSKPSWLSAPKIYTRLTASDVMVSEFADGVRASQLLALVEARDLPALADLREQGISPEIVGKRLQKAEFWSYFEALFFHGDPEASDLLVQPGGRLLFLDFGSCGTIPPNTRDDYRELMQRLMEHDAAGMAEVALQLMAPLPEVDLYELKKALEAEFHRLIFALKDKHSAWWERGSAALWLALLDATRSFEAPVGYDVLRLARACLLYDATVFRLDPNLKLVRGYRKHLRAANSRAARRYRNRIQGVSLREAAETAAARVDNSRRQIRRAAWAAGKIASEVRVELTAAIGKAAYFSQCFIHFAVQTGVMAIAAILGGIIWRLFAHAWPDLTWRAYLWHRVLLNPLLALVALANLVVTIRRVLFRLEEKDPSR